MKKILLETNKSFLVPNEVYGYDQERTQSVEGALELLFRELNHVDRTELISALPDYKSLRSMCVEDEVLFRGPGGWRRQYRCEPMGWSLLSGSNGLQNMQPETLHEQEEADRYGV